MFFNGLVFPCSNCYCQEWDSDASGGHCMCADPPCLEKSKKLTKFMDKKFKESVKTKND